MKNKILSVKRVFIFSLVIFVIYCATYPKDGSPPNQNMVTLGAISLCLIVISGFILLYRLVTKKNSHSTSNNSTITKNLELEKHRACFASKIQPIKTNSYDSFNSDGEDDYQDNLFQDKDFGSFEDGLKTIWNNDSHHIISFNYSNASREIQLTAVKINDRNEVYFVGYCFDSNDDRTFKAERIIFPIEYAGQRYSVDRFLTQALGLKRDYVTGLDF